jgi:hypothetical protein
MGKFSRAVRDMQDSVYRLTHSNEKHVNDFGGASEFTLTAAEKEEAIKEAKTKAEPNIQGVDPVCKTYYEGPFQVDGQILWVDVPPRQLSKKLAAKLDRIGVKGNRILSLLVSQFANFKQSTRPRIQRSPLLTAGFL